ncbi:hypothetical protein G7Y89_g775 [Cudoniella acicularis]|uniref:Uncharacterized protein n=1 Tax=Cudoniella acicularis TaxID=354080 RepID=A0A8H4RWJ2_9HELO|nr:hypothetical protein G7Y89_g775 [Cudoniella acicularis]
MDNRSPFRIGETLLPDDLDQQKQIDWQFESLEAFPSPQTIQHMPPYNTYTFGDLPDVFGTSPYHMQTITTEGFPQQISSYRNTEALEYSPYPAILPSWDWMGFDQFRRQYTEDQTSQLAHHPPLQNNGESKKHENIQEIKLPIRASKASSRKAKEDTISDIATVQTRPSRSKRALAAKEGLHAEWNYHERQPKRFRGLPGTLVTVFDAGQKQSEAKRPSRKCYSDECGTGSPCASCNRRTANVDIARQICIRESPFEDLSVTEFYGSSCRTRVIDFSIDVSNADGIRDTITLDGKGAASSPLILNVLHVKASLLNSRTIGNAKIVHQLHSKYREKDQLEFSGRRSFTVLDPELEADLGEFAVQYTEKFTHQYNPCGSSLIFALEYARRNLPFSTLVENAAKLLALHFLLEHGVKITTKRRDIDTRIIGAQIDTLLFRMGTCSALFRTSFPLFIDFEDKFNYDLIGNDVQMLGHARKLQGTSTSTRKPIHSTIEYKKSAKPTGSKNPGLHSVGELTMWRRSTTLAEEGKNKTLVHNTSKRFPRPILQPTLVPH